MDQKCSCSPRNGFLWWLFIFSSILYDCSQDHDVNRLKNDIISLQAKCGEQK